MWLLSVAVACPTHLIGCQVCGQPPSHWPQISKAQREGRSWGEEQLESAFPFAGALPILSICRDNPVAKDLREAG